MKTLFTSAALLLFALSVSAQNVINITTTEYETLKANNQLVPGARYQFVQDGLSRPAVTTARHEMPVSAQSTTCNCMVPLDTTFQVVAFQFATPPDYRNDDMSSSAIAIPFSFNFFGVMYDSIFINNNGNISFGSSYVTFTANAFPDSTYAMIAPFWADVDTRDISSGLVYYQISPTHIVIRWDSVGYYSMHGDKRNTFQLIITDGMDTILPPNTNVSFCYGDMQWTTGDASLGANGFGGIASTTGVNQGNGSDYFQSTRSVDSTFNFDGPYNNDDGVSWLDDLEMTFNTALTGNVPPLVMNNTICDTIDVFTGDTIRIAAIDSIEFEFYSITPEVDQTVSTIITTNAPAGALTYTQTMNSATGQTFHCVFDARNLAPGMYYVTATATDNGVPAMTSSASVYIETHFDSTLTVGEAPSANGIKMYPNPATDVLNIEHSINTSKIVISDVNGAIISATTATGTQNAIDTKNLAPGIYFVQLVNADGSVIVDRFVKY